MNPFLQGDKVIWNVGSLMKLTEVIFKDCSFETFSKKTRESHTSSVVKLCEVAFWRHNFTSYDSWVEKTTGKAPMRHTLAKELSTVLEDVVISS